MEPVDKRLDREKDTVPPPDDLRVEWEKEDIENEGRKPDLDEVEEDTSAL